MDVYLIVNRNRRRYDPNTHQFVRTHIAPDVSPASLSLFFGREVNVSYGQRVVVATPADSLDIIAVVIVGPIMDNLVRSEREVKDVRILRDQYDPSGIMRLMADTGAFGSAGTVLMVVSHPDNIDYYMQLGFIIDPDRDYFVVQDQTALHTDIQNAIHMYGYDGSYMTPDEQRRIDAEMDQTIDTMINQDQFQQLANTSSINRNEDDAVSAVDWFFESEIMRGYYARRSNIHVQLTIPYIVAYETLHLWPDDITFPLIFIV